MLQSGGHKEANWAFKLPGSFEIFTLITQLRESGEATHWGFCMHLFCAFKFSRDHVLVAMMLSRNLQITFSFPRTTFEHVIASTHLMP